MILKISIFFLVICLFFSSNIASKPIFAHHILNEIPIQRPMDLSLHNGLLYVSNMGKSSISIINTTTDKITNVIDSKSKAGIVDVSSIPKKIYVAPLDSGTIEVYDSSSKNLSDIIHLPNAVYQYIPQLSQRVLTGSEYVAGVWSMDYNPQSKILYAAYFQANKVLAIDTTNDKIVSEIPVADHPISLKVDPSTNTVLVASYVPNKLTFISTKSNQVVGEVETGANPSSIGLDDTYHRAYVTNSGSYYVTVVDTKGHQVIGKIPISSPGHAIAVDQNEHSVYVAQGSSVDKINAANNEIVTTVDLGVIPQGIAVDSNTHKLYVSSQSGNKILVVGPEVISLTMPVVSVEQPFVILGNVHIHGQDVKPTTALLSLTNKTLVLRVNAVDGGNLGIDIPRTLLDSKTGQNDSLFKVLLNGHQSKYTEIKGNASRSTSRSLDFYVLPGTRIIQIIGNQGIAGTK